MAACGGLEHIFETTLALPPWKSVDHHSLTEIYENNNYLVNDQPSSVLSKNNDNVIDHHKRDDSISSNSECISTCTEELEADQDYLLNYNHNYYNNINYRKPEKMMRSYSRKDYGTQIPPPISCLGRNGKPWVFFKSIRKDGRFILKEIRIPTQEFLHACRKNGRLKMHFIHSDDEILDDDDDDEDEDEDGNYGDITDAAGDIHVTHLELDGN